MRVLTEVRAHAPVEKIGLTLLWIKPTWAALVLYPARRARSFSPGLFLFLSLSLTLHLKTLHTVRLSQSEAHDKKYFHSIYGLETSGTYCRCRNCRSEAVEQPNLKDWGDYIHISLAT